MTKSAKTRIKSKIRLFDDLPEDLMESSSSSAETLFAAFMDTHDNGATQKIKSSFVRSITRNSNFKTEIPVDLAEAAHYFSMSDAVTAKMPMNLSEDDGNRLDDIRFIIHNLLPDLERDIMVLTFDHGKIQEDIGAILGLSQEMVNYYKKRAIHRILHLYEHKKIDVNDMETCLKRYVSKKQLEAMMLYFFKHNQRLISKELKISQSAVSARLKIGLRKLKKRAKYDKKAEKYYEIFEKLMAQKSLYSSQTRIKMISNVDNYKQQNEKNVKDDVLEIDTDDYNLDEIEDNDDEDTVAENDGSSEIEKKKEKKLKKKEKKQKMQINPNALRRARDFFKKK